LAPGSSAGAAVVGAGAAVVGAGAAVVGVEVACVGSSAEPQAAPTSANATNKALKFLSLIVLFFLPPAQESEYLGTPSSQNARFRDGEDTAPSGLHA
jgi:hypothetical protein